MCPIIHSANISKASLCDRQKIDGDSRQSLKQIFEVSSIDSVKMHKLSTGEMQFL